MKTIVLALSIMVVGAATADAQIVISNQGWPVLPSAPVVVPAPAYVWPQTIVGPAVTYDSWSPVTVFGEPRFYGPMPLYPGVYGYGGYHGNYRAKIKVRGRGW